LLQDNSEHASVAYNNIGTHLARSRPKTTPSEAKLANFATYSIK